MQPDQPSILLNKVTRLRRVYLQKIPQIISEMRNLCLGLEADSTDDEALVELHRLFHGIRGTAASFGMTCGAACKSRPVSGVIGVQN